MVIRRYERFRQKVCSSFQISDFRFQISDLLLKVKHEIINYILPKLQSLFNKKTLQIGRFSLYNDKQVII